MHHTLEACSKFEAGQGDDVGLLGGQYTRILVVHVVYFVWHASILLKGLLKKFDPHFSLFKLTSNPLTPIPLDSYFMQFETIQKILKIPRDQLHIVSLMTITNEVTDDQSVL